MPATINSLLLLLLLLPRALASRRTLQDGAPHVDTADVVVIGAGIAGVSAAANLTAAGAKVIVLEARERSGGRLLSTPTDHGPVDLGAMWVHEGFAGNELFDLAVSLNAPLSPAQDYTSYQSFHANGTPSDSMGLTNPVYLAWLDDVLIPIANMRQDPAAVDVPLASLVLGMLAAHPQWTQQQVMQANLMMNTNFQVLLNANATALSALRYGDAKTLPAIDVLLPQGFDSLVNALKKGLDIRYNAPAVAVTQDDAGITVTAADGANFTARYAITTQSLGVLKEGRVRFAPGLPPEKQRAIADMGMGLLDKCILVFDSVFWGEADFISREAADWGGLWTVFLNYNKTLGMPVLVALNAADTARGLEAMSDDQVVSSLMGVLRMMFGARVPAAPAQAIVTRWGADPWARGSYSFYALGNPLNITDALAAPMGRLLFAGEATSAKPGTALGAYLSGLREGQRVAALLRAPADGA